MHFMRMTPSWVSPSALRGRKAFIGRRAGMTEAVTSEGELILRLPLPLRSAQSRLEDWGVKVLPGRLPVTRVALAAGTAFQQKVWRACLEIGRGESATYGELARRIGCRSAQAVGQALGANPLAQVIPCHRIRSAQGPGGFAWGPRLKSAWLKEESGGAA
jgi:O-6-methylguanine DNA methyltransferase